jgi:hypothetical protein
MIYYEDEYAVISWDEIALCVIAKWKGFIPLENYTMGMSKVLELLEQNQARKYILDISEAGALSPEHTEWIRTEWRPRAFTTNLAKIATILPQSVLSKLVMQDLIKDTPPQWEVNYFADQKEALDWLRSK